MVYSTDKTEFIVLMNELLSALWILVIAPIFLSFEAMLILALWGGLAMGSKRGKDIAQELKLYHHKLI